MSRAALAPGHAREYETVYILRPNIDKEVADGVATRIAGAITENDGKLTEAELWGSRRLSYPIAKHFRGTYVYLKYLSKGEAVAELERQLRLADAVIRYQTIQLHENVKVAEVEVSPEDVSLDFELPDDPDEPELTREKELGLHALGPDRRRRHDRDFRRDGDSGDAAKETAGTDQAKGTEAAAADADKPAAAADADKPAAAADADKPAAAADADKPAAAADADKPAAADDAPAPEAEKAPKGEES